MKDKILSLLKTRTVYESVITSSATIINAALGMVFYILLARYLGPSSFGIFSVSVATLTLLGDISDVGTGTGIVKFVGKYIVSEKQRALKVLKLSLEIKILFSLIVLALGWFLIPIVAWNFFKKPELVYPLRLSLLGVGGALLFSFSTSAIQALQKFWAWGGLIISSNLLRLLVIFILFYTGFLSLNSSLWVYILFPFFGFLGGLLFLPKFLVVKGEGSVIKELLSFNKWVAIFTLIAAVASRLDTFLITRFLTLEDVGIYSVANNLASVVPQIVFALGVVVAPKLASFDNNPKVISYLKKFQLFVIGLAIIGLVFGIPLSYFVIPHFYGAAYYASIAPFIILLVAQSIFLISVPVHTSIIYYFAYPKLFVWITLGQLFIVGILGWFFIANFGIVGAALAILVGDLFGLVVPAVWVMNKFKKSI